MQFHPPTHPPTSPAPQVQELANRPTCFRQLIFSNDGNLLVAVADGTAYVLDAFTGAPRHAVRMAPHDAPQSQVRAARAGGRGGGGRVRSRAAGGAAPWGGPGRRSPWFP